MNRVSITMSAEDFMNLMLDEYETVEALRARMRELFKAEPDGRTRPVGRPLQAEHPHLSQTELKYWRDHFFIAPGIAAQEDWYNQHGQQAARFAADQRDMGSDEIRLSNGVVALLNIGMPDIGPTRRADECHP
jgi:hypothetical protein